MMILVRFCRFKGLHQIAKNISPWNYKYDHVIRCLIVLHANVSSIIF